MLAAACLALCLLPFLISSADPTESYTSNDTGPYTVRPAEIYTDGMIRVNEADAEELQELPGIGETYSMLIISEREENGPFYYPEDLLAVKGIGTKTLQKFRSMIDLAQKESGE